MVGKTSLNLPSSVEHFKEMLVLGRIGVSHIRVRKAISVNDVSNDGSGEELGSEISVAEDHGALDNVEP